ncbi:MAG: DnaA regulatory inactivator Hda [Nitrococcus mobilis]|nr:DnaA regulatory inactivator Hda [Nitrococcus mobilis]
MAGIESNDRRYGRQLALNFQWDERCDFAGFVVGPNAEAVAALEPIGKGDRRCVIYLYGESGVGKSHLLQAACSEASARGRTVVYLPLAQLVSRSPRLLQELERVDVVALDDLGCLAETIEWQQATFHLFNRLQDAGRELLLAGPRRPAKLGLALPDLVSRLQGALVLRLEQLGDEDNVLALHWRARRRGLELPRETVRYLLNHCRRDTGYFFHLLDELDAASLQTQRRLTVPFVKKVLAEANND